MTIEQLDAYSTIISNVTTCERGTLGIAISTTARFEQH